MAKSGETKVAHNLLLEFKKLMSEPFTGENLVSLKEVIIALEQTKYLLDYPVPNHNGLLFLQKYQSVTNYDYYSLKIVDNRIYDSRFHFDIEFDAKFASSSIHTNSEFLQSEITEYLCINAQKNFYHPRSRKNYLLETLGENVGFREEYFPESVRSAFQKKKD